MVKRLVDGDKPISVLLCQTQISRGQVYYWTRCSAVKGRQPIARHVCCVQS